MVRVAGTREAVLSLMVADICVKRLCGHDPLPTEHRRREDALARLLPERSVGDTRAFTGLVKSKERLHFRVSSLRTDILAANGHTLYYCLNQI